LAEQENHNLCVGGSNPFAATKIMIQISNYLKEAKNLGEHVNKVSIQLNNNNAKLNELTQQLVALFNLFSRGDELIKITQDYSNNLQNDINNVKRTLANYEKGMGKITNRLLHTSELLKSMTDMLKDILTNAGLFVESAQSLAHLAKNTEIRAHHAKKEGKGLAIIAKECLGLAKLAQLPFRDFSTLLQNLEMLAKPVITELSRIIELSSRSRTLLSKSFESLKVIDETTISLQKIITQIEENNIISSQLKMATSAEMDVLKNQLLTSLSTIDDISMRCAQINSLSQILDTLDNILHTINHDATYNRHDIEQQIKLSKKQYLDTQYNFCLTENITNFNRLSTGKEPPLFSNQVYNNILNIANQIDALNISVTKLAEHKDNLGYGMAEVIDLGIQIENFLKETEHIYNHLTNLGLDLDTEIQKIEKLMSTTSKIFSKIKTLAVFARIEQGRSVKYNAIIIPIVEEFIGLEAETEKAFSSINPLIMKLKKNVQSLKREKISTHLEKIKPPDYSKIKIFLDDIIRVFSEEKEKITGILQLIERLNDDNLPLQERWKNYEKSIAHILNIAGSFNDLFKEKKIMAPQRIKGKNIVSVNLTDDPLTLYPDLKTDITSHQIICSYSAGLFQSGEGVDIIPALCENYSISDSGTEYIFKLRDGIKYQNGKAIEIEDIKEAFIKALKGPNSNFFDMIVGAKDFTENLDITSLGIKILDNSTLAIKMEYPFLPILANLATDIADPYLDEELPIGAGPFRLAAWEKGKRVSLSANDYYFEGRPTIDELRFVIIKDEEEAYELFKKGILSIYIPSGEALKRIRATTPKLLYTIPELSIQYLCLNCQKDPFDNKLVRKALAYAVDTRQLVNIFLQGNALAAKGIFPPSMKVYNHKLKGYTYNPQKARDFLREVGFKNGLPGVYTLDVSDTISVIKRAEFIKSSLSKIGVRIEINPMPWHNLIEKTFAGDSTLSFRGWISDNGDPDNFVYPLFHSSSHGPSGNTFFFTSPEIDQAIDNARKIRNLNQRILLYRQLEEKILDESPGVFLFHRLQNIAIQKDILGLKPHPLGLIRTKHVYPVGKRCFVQPDTNEAKQEELLGVSKMVYSRP
jgi:peptide/nickel transport system substrate-binding protein